MNAETKIEDAVKAVADSKPDVELRVTRRIEIGTVLHQGDVYLHRVANNHPRGEKLGTRQVAVGTTIGSRHIVEGPVEVFAGKALPKIVKVPAWCRDNDMLGPVVVASETFTLTHPEHAHHQCPAGTYQVTFQADFSTMRRVSD